MQKKSKLMIYVQTDLAPDVMRWAIRLEKPYRVFAMRASLTPF